MTKKYQHKKRKTIKQDNSYVNQVLSGGANSSLDSKDSGILPIKGTNGVIKANQYSKEKLTSASITIKNSVKEIGDNAFKECSNLTHVEFEPGSILEKIGNGVFKETSIATITIPKSVTDIKRDAFASCKKLQSVTFEPGSKLVTIEATVFSGSAIVSIELPPSLNKIGDRAFANCKSLKSITISASVNVIGKNVFIGCENLKSVIFEPGSKVIITEDMFSESSIETIELPNSVIRIGNKAFFMCKSLKSITIPASVKEIGVNAFIGCENLKSVIFEPDSDIKIIPLNTFSGTALEAIELPKTLGMIEMGAFENCKSLKSITIPASVKVIDLKSFLNCEKLESVIFEENSILAYIGGAVFSKTAIKTIELPSLLKTIESSSFAECIELESITIPEMVIDIGVNAFFRCNKLKSVMFKKGSHLLEGSHLLDIGQLAFSETDVETIVLPKSIKKIGGKAFEKCNKLTSITIPSSITEIGEHAFGGCENLKTVNIELSPPSNYSRNRKAIDATIFTGCENLENREDIIERLRHVPKPPSPPILTITEVRNNTNYIEKQNEKKAIFNDLLVNKEKLKKLEDIQPLHDGYIEINELMHGFSKDTHNILSSSIINDKQLRNRETLRVNKLQKTTTTDRIPSNALDNLLIYIKQNDNINKCAYIVIEGSPAIDASGLAREFCNFIGNQIKIKYMKNLSPELCVNETMDNNDVDNDDFDLNKKVLNLAFLKEILNPDGVPIDNVSDLSKLLYYFMFTMSPLQEDNFNHVKFGYDLNIYLSDFTLMMIFGMFEKIGLKVKLSKFIQDNIIDILEKDGAPVENPPVEKYISNDNDSSSSSSNNDNENYTNPRRPPNKLSKYTPPKESNNKTKKYKYKIDEKILQYIGILFGLDEMNISEDYLKPFVKDIITGDILLSPIEILFRLLYKHIHGVNKNNMTNLLKSYKDLKKDIEILESISIQIKALLNCNIDSCFTVDDRKLTLYELSSALIQPSIDIDISKFMEMIRCTGKYGLRPDDLTISTNIIKEIFSSLNNIQLRYLFRYVTGNITMPHKFSVLFSDVSHDGKPTSFFEGHTCGWYAQVWSYNIYKNKTLEEYNSNIKHIQKQRRAGKIIDDPPAYVIPEPNQYKSALQGFIESVLEIKGFDMVGGSRQINKTKSKKSKLKSNKNKTQRYKKHNE